MIAQLEETIIKDNDITVFSPRTAFSKGQLSIMPNEKFTILEQVPDKLLTKMFQVANKLSAVLFEVMKCQGTNIFIQNGISAGQVEDNFSIQIIPRYENDGLKLEWEPKQASEEELKKTISKFQDAESKEKEAKLMEQKKIEIEKPIQEKIIIDEGENYMVKNLDRLP